ncbi:hypothetical protein ON010_g9730 [Phytophthora cinnamomi]|nr:hypothetical protein ON010_g9730 [Phytophthora cinnamomi]
MASSAPTTTGLESPEALARLNAAIMGERNPRGIPSAVFVVRLRGHLHGRVRRQKHRAARGRATADVQQVQVHGDESAEEPRHVQAQDPGHAEGPGHGAAPAGQARRGRDAAHAVQPGRQRVRQSGGGLLRGQGLHLAGRAGHGRVPVRGGAGAAGAERGHGHGEAGARSCRLRGLGGLTVEF